jgi:hypothetical protein
VEHQHDHHHVSTRGIHGMLVLGGQRTDDAMRSPVYASHLPMFMGPHDFQVIMRVTGEAAGTYGDFVAHFGSGEIYTFEPQPFAIDELDPAAEGGPARTSVDGALYRGHFERGGSEIAADTSFVVEQVLHFRQFPPVADGGERGPLRYLCFGQPDAAFLAHVITSPPDFDQILPVQLGARDRVSDDDLRNGVVLSIPDRANEIEARLAAGDTVTGEVQPEQAPSDTDGPKRSIELTVASEYYFETGDLAEAM